MQLNLNTVLTPSGAQTPEDAPRPGPAVKGTQTFNCHIVVEGGVLFAGASDGLIMSWKPTKRTGFESMRLPGHKGAVHCLEYLREESSNQKLMLSGSADRTIKVWDPWIRDAGAKNACIQTLVGHGGTITAIQYGDGCIISCSSDKTIKVWQAEPGRQNLLHPWFSVVQTIENSDNWATAAALRTGEVAALYVGDSSGSLSVYAPQRGHSNEWTGFALQRRQEHIHRLGITHTLLVPEQNFIITLSFDTSMRVFDALTGAPFLTINNPRRCRFTGLDWNTQEQELFLIDAQGYVSAWNIYMEKCLKEQQLTGRDGNALTSISLQPSSSRLCVTADGGCLVEQWDISRDLKVRAHRGL